MSKFILYIQELCRSYLIVVSYVQTLFNTMFSKLKIWFWYHFVYQFERNILRLLCIFYKLKKRPPKLKTFKSLHSFCYLLCLDCYIQNINLNFVIVDFCSISKILNWNTHSLLFIQFLYLWKNYNSITLMTCLLVFWLCDEELFIEPFVINSSVLVFWARQVTKSRLQKFFY